VLPFFDEIRYHSDRLELLIDDELWSMVKYRELLFLR
jgi:glutamine synthetase